MGFHRVPRDVKGSARLVDCGGGQEPEKAQLGLGQRVGERAGGGGLGVADLGNRGNDALHERVPRQLGMPEEVAGHLRRGGNNGAEKAVTAGGVQDIAHYDRGRRVAAPDRGRDQQYLALQRAPRGQPFGGQCLQAVLRGPVVTGGQGDLGQEQVAAGRGQPAGQPGRDLPVAE
jgi:hypothetical protein